MREERLNFIESGNILVVDDTPENLDILIEMLEKRGYAIRATTSGRLALDAVEKFIPDLILLDINMPDMNGFEVCRKFKAIDKTRKVPVVFISAITETIDKVKAFAVGGIDYITKPFQNEEVLARVSTNVNNRKMQIAIEKYSISLEEMVAAQVKEIHDSQMSTILALAKLAESRDDDTGKHLERVQTFCKLLSEELANKQKYKNSITSVYIQNIYNAAPLHDIGKVGILDNILLKPGKLAPEEFEIMKTHTTIGAQTLEAVRKYYPKNTFINMGIAIARSHHEKWDGSGYPDGISGEDIPLSARIMTVVDVYDALRAKRCYKQPFTHKETSEIIVNAVGTQFCPDSIGAFKKLMDRFEKTFLELSDYK